MIENSTELHPLPRSSPCRISRSVRSAEQRSACVRPAAASKPAPVQSTPSGLGVGADAACSMGQPSSVVTVPPAAPRTASVAHESHLEVARLSSAASARPSNTQRTCAVYCNSTKFPSISTNLKTAKTLLAEPPAWCSVGAAMTSLARRRTGSLHLAEVARTRGRPGVAWHRSSGWSPITPLDPPELTRLTG